MLRSISMPQPEATPSRQRRDEISCAACVALYDDGSAYHGALKGHRFHGWGHYVSPNGDEYLGTFRHGWPHGEGVWRNARGKCDAGDFHYGVPPSCVGQRATRPLALLCTQPCAWRRFLRLPAPLNVPALALQTLGRLKFEARDEAEAIRLACAFYDACGYPDVPTRDLQALVWRRALIARLDSFPRGDEVGRAAVGLPICGQACAPPKHQALRDAQDWQRRRYLAARRDATAASSSPERARLSRVAHSARLNYWGALFA